MPDKERSLDARETAELLSVHVETGRQLARSDHPSLILLDMNLPGLDGGETAQCLADELKTADIPVIFVSGLITRRDETELGPGGYPLIGKPFERAKLLGMVQKYMRAFRRPAVPVTEGRQVAS